MPALIKNNWQTEKGTWLMVSNKLTVEELWVILQKNPKKYGQTKEWKEDDAQ